MNPFIGEMFGTMVLILLGNGVVANVVLNKNKGQNSGWIVITAGWAFAVMTGVFVSLALGGPGSLNPAGVIQGFFAPGANIGEGLTLIAAQFLGAIIGAILVWLAYMDHFNATPDGPSKLACFSTGPAIRNPVNNLVTEIIGTFALVFIVNAIATVSTGGTNGLFPALVGGLIWGLGLSLGGPTGYALNPARDLGPRIAHAILPLKNKGDSDWGYSWIPVVGPIIGAIIGGVLFRAIAG
ncbi:MAG: aquaporin family protein [Chloroflexaceae bacterium]|jgi:glycerol uptake facilitator protein|nr:aquaporin family protein [Chloroflexaceae bacterium]